MANEAQVAEGHDPETQGLADAIGVDGGHAGESVGMPQLDFATFGNQIFWLLITLVVIYFVLSRIALPRISAVLAERQGIISNDIAAAEELKLKAVEAEEAYNQALADARVEAGRIVAEARVEIQADLDVAIAKADAEIAAKSAESEKAIADIRASAMDSVKVVAKDTAKEIVAALGGKADAKSITAAVTERLKG
jgi:F-type H+-transporting ATPase subunit b